jgi:hypothetical protein
MGLFGTYDIAADAGVATETPFSPAVLYGPLRSSTDVRGKAAMCAEAARWARSREDALERVGHALAETAAAPALEPANPRLAWAVKSARNAGLGGAVGIAWKGDGCFAVAREIWQPHLSSTLAISLG